MALPESTPGTLYSLFEVFAAVGVAWCRLTGEETPARRMEVRIIARDRSSFRSAAGPPIAADTGLADAPAADAVVVTDLELTGDPRGRWGAEAEWLRGQFARGAMACSVCTGSLFLAESGILDGHEATTHWSATGIFRDCYPGVRLRPERILCPAGPEHRIVTSGGAASWEDLALSLIGRFCGEAETVRISKIFLLGDHSDGQLPFSAMGRPRRHEDPVIAECQAWIADHYDADCPVACMVQRSGLSERTFKRRFKQATGYAPIDYIQSLRIEEAKQMLETSVAPTDAVARVVGYDDPTFFRRLFKRRTGVTPARYRRRIMAVSSRARGARL